MESITLGQKEELARVIADATRKGVKVALEKLVAPIDRVAFQRVLEKGDEITKTVLDVVIQKVVNIAGGVVGILKLISGETLELDPTDGTDTIANNADGTFNYVDDEFQNWGTNVPSEPTGPTKVQVFEQVQDGDHKAIFTGVNQDLDRLCLTQNQIKQFVRKYKNAGFLNYWTRFLFKVEKDGKKEFFVAHVNPYSDGYLRVYCSRFSSGSVWYAEDRYRVVLPQQALGS